MINEQIELFKATIKGKKIAVLGLGISNLPAIKFLHKFGAVITARDRTPYDELDNDKLTVWILFWATVIWIIWTAMIL